MAHNNNPKKIRIGDTFTLRWNVSVNHGSTPLSSFSNVHLVLTDPISAKMDIEGDWRIDGNIIELTVEGSKTLGELKKWRLGNYRLTCIVNYKQSNQAIADRCYAFCLVASTCEVEDDGIDIDTDIVVNLPDSDLWIGVKGSDGVTPHIGDNGNWWFGDTDTGIRAQGDSSIDISNKIEALEIDIALLREALRQNAEADAQNAAADATAHAQAAEAASKVADTATEEDVNSIFNKE